MMDLNLQENELISTFDFGIQTGNIISDSDYIWCVDSKSDVLLIKNVRDKTETSLPYHQFGIASNEKFSIITAKDFEYNKQRYLLVSLETNRFILAMFKLSVSKVICAFESPGKVTQMEILVKNHHFIETNKNQTFFSNFEVSAVCACTGGALHIYDITPTSDLHKLSSNENSPSSVYWYQTQDLIQEKQTAVNQSKIFGLSLNNASVSQTHFKYMMPNDHCTASLPIDLVKITSLKYEKQIDSLLVGFSFGCFQIWDMKSLKIESSSGYGENTKPVIGFSLIQPQNDPKKCVYLMVAHSRVNIKTSKSAKKNLGEDEDEDDEPLCLSDDEFEIDEDEDESDSSFILMYQLMFEKCVNIFLNQNESYLLYEDISSCSIAFEHEFSVSTLECVKTSYPNEMHESNIGKCVQSKIVSIQTLNIINNRLQIDLACVVWALVDKATNSTDFYLSVFNLNNWYTQCMPAKMRPLSEIGKNIYFSNFTLSINAGFEDIKLISVIDSKIKKIKNQNLLSNGNCLKKLLISESDSDIEYEGLESDDETHLSMHFDLLVMTPFTLSKLSIKPIEHQIHQFISKQDDLIHSPDQVYYLLSRYHLIDKYTTNDSQPMFIPIFNYLLETSQIYAILKSLWKLNTDDTSIISDFSLKAVLDWSWSKVIKLKTELNNLYKLISTKITNYLNHSLYAHDLIEPENLCEFLQRENNQLENLIQIYKQFLKLDTTNEGYLQLNKKLCVIESLKCYIEHLILFNKFDILIPPSINANPEDLALNNTNYLNEMQINFKIIENRWAKRRQQQFDDQKPTQDSNDKNKYPFTYMIDCIIEECKLYANTSKIFLRNTKPQRSVKFADENEQDELVSQSLYPPRSINELLEICLECNLSTKMKQILILYVLCDLMHTEVSPQVQKHVLKLINAYCSTTFTLMSTTLDSALSVPWSSSTTSIVSLSTDPNDPNNSSCLFDLVNGLYLIDSQFVERAFNYLRATDLNYLEFYEKYFILYNSVHLKEFKIALQYLWLFQKLNASSLGNSKDKEDDDLNNPQNGLCEDSNLCQIENDLKLFKFVSKTSSNLNDFGSKLKHEQKMHSRLILTIYLANSLVNEAYDIVKPHFKHVKTTANQSVKLSKELVVHFFTEAEKFKLWKQVKKLSTIDSDFLLMIFNYLEAKQDLSSICMAIDLHVDNRNYKRAIDLYEKYSKQICASEEYNYLSSVIEIAKDMQDDYTSDTSRLGNKQFNLITPSDLKETASFQYKFTVPLKDLCKSSSKRCINLLSLDEDLDYVNLLRFPDIEHVAGKITTPSKKTYGKIANDVTNLIQTDTPSNPSILNKRKASTPHPSHSIRHIQQEQESPADSQKCISASETKNRVLTSSLKLNKNVSQSVSKSVKFKMTRFTREISNENIYDREEIAENLIETEIVCESEIKEFSEQKNDDGRKKLEFLEDDEDNDLLSNELVLHDDSDEINQQDEPAKEITETLVNLEETKKVKEINEHKVITQEKEVESFESMESMELMETIETIETIETVETMESAKESLKSMETMKTMESTKESLKSMETVETMESAKESLKLMEKNEEILETMEKNKELMEKDKETLETMESNKESLKSMENNEETFESMENNKEILETIENNKETLENNKETLKSMESMENNKETLETMGNNKETLESMESTKESFDNNFIDFEFDIPILTSTDEIRKSILNKLITPIKQQSSFKVNTEFEIETPSESTISNVSTSPMVINHPALVKCSTIAEFELPEKSNNQFNLTTTGLSPIKLEQAKVEFTTSNSDSTFASEPIGILDQEIEPVKETLNIDDTINDVVLNPEVNEQTKIQEDDIDMPQGLDDCQTSTGIPDEPQIESLNAVNPNTSLNSSTKTLEEECEEKHNQSINESFDLNMSSVSNNSGNPGQKTDQAENKEDRFVLPDDHVPRMSRTNSETSLFSHISSVSEHYEKLKNQEDEDKELEKGKRAIKRRAPVAKSHHLDDNELSVKASAEKLKPGKVSLQRRRSDLSSSSSTSIISSTSHTDVARLHANLPPTLGSTDQEVRLTRGKLKTLLEQPSDEPVVTTKPARVTRRNSKRETKLEQVEENEEELKSAETSSKISISNLKKHNAQMEKLDQIAEANPTEKASKRTKIPSTRTTRSKQRSPSPTASSIVSVESVLTITSVVTPAKTRGRPKLVKKVEETPVESLKEEDDAELRDKPSPSNSCISVSSMASMVSMTSVASSVATRTTRKSTRKTKETAEPVDQTSPVRTSVGGSKSYNLRSKGKSGEDLETVDDIDAKIGQSAKKTTRTRSFRSAVSEDVVEEKPKKASVTRTRSLRSSTDVKPSVDLDVESAKPSLIKISEGVEVKVADGFAFSNPRVLLTRAGQESEISGSMRLSSGECEDSDEGEFKFSVPSPLKKQHK